MTEPQAVKTSVWASVRDEGRDLCRTLHEGVRSTPRVHLLCLFMLTVWAVVLRYTFLFQPMRFDEAFTFIHYLRYSLPHSLSAHYYPNNHLLHTALMYVCYKLLGNEPWILRLPTFIAGVLMVPAMYAAARVIYDRWAGLLAATMVACSSVLIEFSTNARGYTMLCLIVLLLLIQSRRLLRERRQVRWLIFSVLVALGFYTLPLMLFPAGMIGLWYLLLALRGQTYAPVKTFIIDLIVYSLIAAGLTVLLYLPVVAVSGLASIHSNRFVQPLSWHEFMQAMPKHGQMLWAQWHRDISAPVSALLVVGIVVSMTLRRWMKTDYLPLILAAVLWIVPIVLARRVMYITPRIWLFLLPVYFLIAASGWVALSHVAARYTPVKLRRLIVIAFPGMVLLLSLYLGASVLHSKSVLASYDTGTAGDAHEAALFIKDILQPDDNVGTSQPNNSASMIYYFIYHDIPTDYIWRDHQRGQRYLLLVDDRDTDLLQDTIDMLRGYGDWDDATHRARRLKRFDHSTLYELDMSPDDGNAGP